MRKIFTKKWIASGVTTFLMIAVVGGLFGAVAVPRAEAGPGGVAVPSATTPASVQTAPPPKPQINAQGCIDFTMVVIPVGINFDACMAKAANIIMSIMARFLWIAGKIFDITLDYSLNFDKILKQVPIVDIGWKVLRDIANILFIFIALWSGISITLGIKADKAWGLLAQMVLVALFINFSLFITQAVVDASNIAALHFYRLMVANPGEDELLVANPGGDELPQLGLSEAFMTGLRLETLYDARMLGTGEAARNAAGSVAASAKQLHPWNIIIIGVFGSIFMLIAAFVFFAAAVLFVIRTITLLMLMLLSPLAFVAWLLPGASGLAHEWWSKLWSQAFFAPLYMALAYVVVATIQQPAFKTYLQGASFAAAITTDGAAPSSILIIFNFILMSGLLIGCLIIAQSLGAKGSSTMISWGHKLAGGAAGGLGGFAGRFAVRGFGTESWRQKAAMGEAKIKEGKAASRGERLAMHTKKWVPNLSIRRLDERLKDSRFGKSALGDTFRKMTTGAAVQAKFGSGTSAEEAYHRDEQFRAQRDDIDRANAAIRNGMQISGREEEMKGGHSQLATLEIQREKEKKAGTSTADTDKEIAKAKNNIEALELKNLADIKSTEKEIARISAHGFAELGKDLLHNPILMRFANRAQTAAAMGSDRLTDTEKDKMLEAKYHWVTEKAEEYKGDNERYEQGVQTFRTAYATELEKITPVDITAAKTGLDPALVASITHSEESTKDALVKSLRDQGKNATDAEIEAVATVKDSIAKKLDARAKESLQTKAKEEATKTDGAINPFTTPPPKIDQRFRRRLRDFPVQEAEWLNRIEPHIFEANQYLTQVIRQGTVNDIGKSQAFGTEQYQVIRDRKSSGVINAADLLDGIPLTLSDEEKGRWRNFFAEHPLPAELNAASLADYEREISTNPKIKPKLDALGGALPMRQLGMLLAYREEGDKRMKEALGGKAQEEQSMMPRRIWSRKPVWKYFDRGGFQTFRSKDEEEKMPVVRDMLVEELKGTLSDFNRTILRWMRTDRGGRTFYTGPLIKDNKEMTYRNVTSDPLMLSRIEKQLRKLGKTLDDKLVVGEGDEWDKIMSSQNS